MKQQKYRGFTLIELLIAVAIVAILAALAIPSYNRYVQKSRRSEAMINLVKFQGVYEEYNAQNNTYPTSNTVPPTTTPPIPSTTYYSYTSVTTSTTYSITATALPGSSQVADTELGTSCATMSVDNIGDQTPTYCWLQ